MWNELEILLCTLIFRIITTNNYLQAAVTQKLYLQEQYRVKISWHFNQDPSWTPAEQGEQIEQIQRTVDQKMVKAILQQKEGRNKNCKTMYPTLLEAFLNNWNKS